MISNHPYEVTAEMMELGQANFIPRDSLRHTIKDSPEAAMKIVQPTEPELLKGVRRDSTLGIVPS